MQVYSIANNVPIMHVFEVFFRFSLPILFSSWTLTVTQNDFPSNTLYRPQASVGLIVRSVMFSKRLAKERNINYR